MSKANNAIKSRSGYGASRYNATKHGLTSARTILPGEDPREYEALHAELVAEQKPAGLSETYWVGEIANLMWRKQRVHRMETGAVRYALAELVLEGFVRGKKPLSSLDDLPADERILFEDIMSLLLLEPQQVEETLADGEQELAAIEKIQRALRENADVEPLLSQLSAEAAKDYRLACEFERQYRGEECPDLIGRVLTNRRNELRFQRHILGIYNSLHDAALADVARGSHYEKNARNESHINRQLERAYKNLFAIKRFKGNAVAIEAD